ncbi:MAG TPA: maleylpyruvate isomerase N-terminal domain-containing protein [Mycobacteriales bacterium]|nr:maleylpyruvate isomerase N-terminal domain-containing protein [Mycobacteriales bacterium]
MLVCSIDHELLVSCEAAAVRRNVDLFQRVDPDLAVPNSRWSAHDVAAHLVTMAGRYLNADRKLARTRRELEEMNDREIADFGTATMGELVGRLRSRVAKYNVFWPEQALDEMFPYREGFPLDAGTLRSNWIAELLVHGRDVAIAAGEQWPLDDTSCLLMLRVLAQVLPRYLHVAGADDYSLVIAPGGGMPFSILVTDGVARIEPSAISDSDQISGSPAALVLLLYRRIDLAEAQQTGLYVSGDALRIRRFLDRLDKP